MSNYENEETITVRLTRTEVERLYEITNDGILWLQSANGYNPDTGLWEDVGAEDSYGMTLTEVSDLLDKFNC